MLICPWYSITTSAGPEGAASIATLADGGFLIVWSSEQGPGGRNVYGQRYDLSGAAVGGEFQVNAYSTGQQRGPSLVSTGAGGFAVVWGGAGQLGGGPGVDVGGIFGSVFDAGGSPVGTEFQVNAYTTGGQFAPQLLELASGDLVVAWASGGQDGDETGVFGRVFAASGAPISSEFQVGTYTTEEATPTDIALLDDGDFLVVWEAGQFLSDPGPDGDAEGGMARRYDPDGTPAGTEFRINPHWQSNQAGPSAAADGNDGFVVVWEDWGRSAVLAMHACVDLSTDSDGDGIGDACDPCDNPGGQTISINPRS